MLSDNFDIVVVGAGPAGLIAAGCAASSGASVLLVEKMEKPARKLRITGKGRCNITNMKPFDEFLEDVFPEPRFLRDAFGAFFSDDIVRLLNDQGVTTVIERGQRVFPASGKAWDVADALVRWAKSKGVEVLCHSSVQKVDVSEGKVKSVSFIDSKRGRSQVVGCKCVVLATGGKSYPATGSTGDGYLLAQSCGHGIVDLVPGLVGLETAPCFNVKGRGVTLKNTNLSLIVDGKGISDEFGEMEFTSFGIDGPIVLKHSRKAIDAFMQGRVVDVVLDLKPALSHQKLDDRLLREVNESPRMSMLDLARKLLPAEVADIMLDHLGLAAQKTVSRLSSDERKVIRLWLKELSFRVTGFRSWDEAIITCGGVPLKEVNPKTMGSRLVNGLFFAGELLDLDGATGGYNLQIAYSTGWLAGLSAAANILPNKEV